MGWGLPASFSINYPLTDQFTQVLLLSPFQRNLPLLFSFFGVFFATVGLRFWTLVIRGSFGRFFLKIHRALSTFFFFSGFFNTVYNSIFNGMFHGSYSLFTKLLDKGLLEYFGPVGFYRLVSSLSFAVRQ